MAYKARYYCKHCGYSEVEARAEGCPRAPRRRYACPMELKSPIRRFFYKLGVLLR